MKYRFIIFILITNLNLYSQDLEHLAKQDTVYIVLKNIDKNFSEQYKGFEYKSTVHTNYALYEIIENHVERIFIEAPKPYPLLTFKKKEFLKKNKNNIIDLKYIEKTGVVKVFIETLKLINPSKIVFFIINERELKKRYITLKQADIMRGLYGKI